jgi:hypothetical protein
MPGGASLFLKVAEGLVSKHFLQSSLRDGVTIPAKLWESRSVPPPVHHFYRLRPRALHDKYNGVDAANFGTVSITLPEGRAYKVRDFHYRLANGQLGMHIVPVSDDGPVQQPDGTWANGSSVVDHVLRARMGLSESDPIYALAAYIRPDEHQLSLDELPSSKKLFYGYKHLGAYFGDGKTTHAPQNYHAESWHQRGHNVWHVRGYPATLFFLSLEAVDQSTLNRNARIVDAVLNDRVLALADFERMRCRVFTLNSALQFYRDWIRESEYLTDYSWFMSCGDHKAVVANVMLNLPHNPQSFLEIFADDGESLWSDFKRRFSVVSGRAFQIDDETHFEPLWKKEGLSAGQVRPLSLAQHNAFDAAIQENRLSSFEGIRPLPSGVAMGWPMETPIDLLNGFASTYLRFVDVGGIVSAAVMVRLASRASDQLGISESQYCALISPIVTRLLIADAKQNASRLADWLTQAKTTFRRVLAGSQASTKGDAGPIHHASMLAEKYFTEVEAQLPRLALEPTATATGALNWLHMELKKAIADLRQQSTSGALATTYFATPGVFHRVAMGAYPCSKFVSVTAVCTVVDQSELELVHESAEFVLSAGHGGSFIETSTVAQRAVPAPAQHSAADRTRSAGSGADTLTYVGSAKDVGRVEPGACASCRTRQLVYAVGQLGYDFGTLPRLDEFGQRMRQVSQLQSCPHDERHLLNFLNAIQSTEPWYADCLLWTLSISGVPVYVLRPLGPYARACSDRILDLFRRQVCGDVEHLVVPGTISGHAVLLNGRAVPVIHPDPSGLSGGTVVDAASGMPKTLLDRIYHEMQNPGQAPRDRALNFAGTYLLQYPDVLENLDTRNTLDTICVEQSKLCRQRSDCWEIKVAFFNPEKPMQTVRQVYCWTIDVAETIPVIVGKVRSWTTAEGAICQEAARNPM